MPIKRLRRAGYYVRQGGLYELGLRLSARRILPDRLFLMNETEIMRWADTNVIAIGRNHNSYECVCADESAIDGLLASSAPNTRELLQSSFRRFFAEKAKCYIVRHNSVIVGYVWAFPSHYVLTYDNYRRRSLVVRSDERSVFLGNGAIDAKYRLRGLFPLLMSSVARQWPKDTQFYTAVDKVNERSRLSHYRLGFVPQCKVLCVTLFGMSVFLRKGSGETHWSLHRPDNELVVSDCLKVGVNRAEAEDLTRV